MLCFLSLPQVSVQHRDAVSPKLLMTTQQALKVLGRVSNIKTRINASHQPPFWLANQAPFQCTICNIAHLIGSLVTGQLLCSDNTGLDANLSFWRWVLLYPIFEQCLCMDQGLWLVWTGFVEQCGLGLLKSVDWVCSQCRLGLWSVWIGFVVSRLGVNVACVCGQCGLCLWSVWTGCVVRLD